MEPDQQDNTMKIEPQPLRPRRQGDNLLRVARVIIVLVAAMAACAGLCYAVMPDAEPVVKPELRRPETIFPPGMLSLHRWRYIVVHHTATEVGDVERIDRYHRQQRDFKNGIGYHFLNINIGAVTFYECFKVGIATLCY